MVRRVILSLYCIAIAYCCLWVPWYQPAPPANARQWFRMGYGWLWVGPHNYLGEYARPDITMIALGLIVASAIFAAIFLIATAKEKRSETRTAGASR